MTTDAPPKKPPQGIPERPPHSTPHPLSEEVERQDTAIAAELPRGELDPEGDDPPELREAPLAELLLWRLGLPRDRVRIQQEHHTDAINLTPPITTRKVADAIAQLSLRVMNGELDATSAKTSLYALQTLLTALRLQILEEKKLRDTKKKPKPARRKHAPRKR